MTHAITRAKERYGIELTAVDFAAICALAEKAGTVRRNGLVEERWVKWGRRVLRVMFDVDRRSIVTFLPPDNHQRKGWKHRPRNGGKQKPAVNSKLKGKP